VLEFSAAFLVSDMKCDQTIPVLIELDRAKGSIEGTENQSTDCKTEIRQSLKKASYRSLGSLARNAFFSDTVEMLCWPLECVFDRGKRECYNLPERTLTDSSRSE
jgi:hypothetical protein